MNYNEIKEQDITIPTQGFKTINTKGRNYVIPNEGTPGINEEENPNNRGMYNLIHTVLKLCKYKVDELDIVDNLSSTDNTKVLSANQGRVLKELVINNSKLTPIEDSLTSSSTTSALSAKQGKELLAIINEVGKAVNSIQSVALGSSSSSSLAIEDTLSSTSTVKALSANQGKVLAGSISAIVSQLTDKAQFDVITNIKNFLSNGVVKTDIKSINNIPLTGGGNIDILIPAPTAVINSLEDDSTTKALSAKQGKELKTTIDSLSTSINSLVTSINSKLPNNSGLKTINNISLFGTGNIDIVSGGSSLTTTDVANLFINGDILIATNLPTHNTVVLKATSIIIYNSVQYLIDYYSPSKDYCVFKKSDTGKYSAVFLLIFDETTVNKYLLKYISSNNINMQNISVVNKKAIFTTGSILELPFLSQYIPKASNEEMFFKFSITQAPATGEKMFIFGAVNTVDNNKTTNSFIIYVDEYKRLCFEARDTNTITSTILGIDTDIVLRLLLYGTVKQIYINGTYIGYFLNSTSYDWTTGNSPYMFSINSSYTTNTKYKPFIGTLSFCLFTNQTTSMYT